MNIISSRKIELNDSELKRAAKSVLVTLPPGIEGTNCGNCQFFKSGFCEHKDMQIKVNSNQCCNYWNREGTIFIG